MMKVCTKCNRELSLDNFHKNCKTKDGLQAWCKDCRRSFRSNKTRKINHNNIIKDLTKLRYRKKKNGLEYEFIGRKRNGKHRTLRFKCLHCGSIVETSLKSAIESDFICDNCKFLKETTIRYINKPSNDYKLQDIEPLNFRTLTFSLPAVIHKKAISDSPFRKIWNNVVNNIIKKNKEKQVSLDISKIKNINFADGKMVVTLGEDLHPQMQNSKK